MPSTFEALLGEGGGVMRQLFVWGLLQTVVKVAGEPFWRKLGYLVNQLEEDVVLDPAGLADAVVRHVRTFTSAAGEAHASGINDSRFKELVDLAGEPPAMQQVLEWWRRGFITFGEPGPTKANVANAIATSRVYTYWTTVIKKAQFVPPSVAEAVNAKLRNQISEDEAIGLAYFAGLGTPSLTAPSGHDTSDTARAFKVLLDTAGRPPAVGELLTLWRRGLIESGDLTPATATPTPNGLTFAQGILEGDTKDKWLPKYAELFTQYPSEYYVHMMLKTGQITKTTAISLLKKLGYTTTVVNGIIGSGVASSTAAYKGLTESIIADLYTAQAIDKTEAKTLLLQIGDNPSVVTFILEYLDLKRILKFVNSAITKVATQFVNGKITKNQASAALSRLGVPSTQVTTLLATWQIEKTTVVKLPTESQYVDAYKYGVISATEALAGLESIGYTPYDAWLVASAALHAKITTTPPKPTQNPLFGLPTTIGG